MLFSLLFYLIPDLFLFFGTPNPFSTQGVVEVLSDRMTMIEFVLFSIFTLPIFVGTELVARVLHRMGKGQLSDRIRAFIYPEDVSESYRQEASIPYPLP